MSKRGNRVTSKDVAVASGVSQATVSFVLNSTPGNKIPEATRLRVRRAAEELGYVPSFAGRTLKRGQSQIVILDMRGVPPFAGMEIYISSFCDVMRQYGCVVTVLTVDGNEHATLEELAQALVPLAVVSPRMPTASQLAFLQNIGVQRISWIDFVPQQHDGQQIAELTSNAQVNYLAEAGCSSIGYVLPNDATDQTYGFDYAAAAGRRALELDLRPVRVIDGPKSPDELCKALQSMVFDVRRPVDAFACYNDDVAFQVLGALSRLDVGVPEQVAVIGVYDTKLASYTVPSLTSVNVPAAAFGTDMARRLLVSLGHSVDTLGPDEFVFSVTRRESA